MFAHYLTTVTCNQPIVTQPLNLNEISIQSFSTHKHIFEYGINQVKTAEVYKAEIIRYLVFPASVPTVLPDLTFFRHFFKINSLILSFFGNLW